MQGSSLRAHEGTLTSRVLAAEGPWVDLDEMTSRACGLASCRIAHATGDGGTTLEAVRIRGQQAQIIHLGDSRTYLFRDSTLRQLTSDHSLVAEKIADGTLTPEAARTDPRRNIVTRALGRKLSPPDLNSLDLLDGDELLLCSDGLTGPVDDEGIGAILSRTRGHLEEAANALIDAAYEGGAPDNVKVLLVGVPKGRKSAPPWRKAKVTPRT